MAYVCTNDDVNDCCGYYSSTNESHPRPLLFQREELLWSRSLLKCFQFYQCPLKRDDATRCEPGHRRLTVAVSPRSRFVRHRRGLQPALLDERTGIGEHSRKAALLAVQPADLRL